MSQQQHQSVEVSHDQEDPKSASSSNSKHGGWITFPFIIVAMAGMSLAAGGWMNNLIVYLIQEFNVKSINAAQIFNVVNGCTLVFPIIAAVLADSFLGCFSVIWISSVISLLGTLVLVLTAAVKNLRPPSCENGSNLCESPTQLQYAVLYIAIALASLGIGGTRYTIGPLGANQFDRPKQQGIFFDWYIFTMYMGSAISATAIVYVEDNVSWILGYGICVAANVVGLIVFLGGGRYYRDIKPVGSPFARLGRVMVAAVLKRKSLLSHNDDAYYYQKLQHDVDKEVIPKPTDFFRFLNRAAIKTKTEGESKIDRSLKKKKQWDWEVCTIEEVEDFKRLIKMIPLWSSGLILCIPLVIQLSLSIITALSMDRHLGSHFKIPAGSMPIFILLSTSGGVVFIDRILFPIWEKIGRRHPITPLQRIGIGHVITILSMAISALVEIKRLEITRRNHLEDLANAVTPMSVFWLVPPLALAGIGEAFTFPGHITFYYREFPDSLKSTSTAVVAMFVGIAFYLGNAVIDLVRKTTDWLPDNINKGRLDMVFWVCCVMGALNFVYYLACALLYKYQSHETKKKNVNQDLT